jgi:hypothetical protein
MDETIEPRGKPRGFFVLEFAAAHRKGLLTVETLESPAFASAGKGFGRVCLSLA